MHITLIRRNHLIAGILISFFAVCCMGETLLGGKATDTKQSTRLYTKPNPALDNGFKGGVTKPRKPIKQIFASATADYKRLYKGKVIGQDKQHFVFEGLPIGKYDLVILYDNTFYEGLTLNREQPNTLNKSSKASIKKIINESTPFFNKKRIHRIKGKKSQYRARCVFQEVRTRPITLQSAATRRDIQVRSIKVGLLKDTGVGWALMETREIVRQEVVKATDHTGLLKHVYNPALGSIRTIGKMKNLGTIDLKE